LSLLFLSPFVVSPAFLRCLNVRAPVFLRTAADQNDEAFAILAEVNPVAFSHRILVRISISSAAHLRAILTV